MRKLPWATVALLALSSPAMATLPLNTLVQYDLGTQLVVGDQVYPQVKLGNGAYSLFGQAIITFTPGAGVPGDAASGGAPYLPDPPFIEIIPQYFHTGPNVPVCFVFDPSGAPGGISIRTFQEADGWHLRFGFSYVQPNPGYKNAITTLTLNFMCPPKAP